MLKAGAVYENGYLLGTSIARPLIAKHQVEVAHAEKAMGVAHGATGKGNDQVRFEITYMALDPTLKIIAPWKDPSFKLTSREAAVDYARQHKIPIEQSKKKIYSRDRNLWHISHEGADLEDPANEPKDDLYVISNPVSRTPDRPDYVTLGFHEGVPVKLDGRLINPVKLVETLNEMGGKHAVGQVDIVENRLVGMKSRGVYETPGGEILMTAHRALETLTLERETMTQRNVTGEVRLKLFKGRCTIAGMKSPNSLYQMDLASFKMGAEYDQMDAKGFIRLFGLPTRVAGVVSRRAQRNE
jgi:argininosuccinate synthase